MALMFKSVLQSGGGAELIVTCDSEFAGATISCSDGTTTLNKTCPVSSPYEVTFKIPNSGDWTVSATVSGTTYSSDPISVDLDYETDLEFGFNWKRWVDTAQYLDSTDYSTLSDLLADEEAVRELCLEHACVDYLCDGASVTLALATVIADDVFAKWVNNSDYALDKMYANAAIKTVMDTADKYGYGEWVITDSTTTPKTWGPKGNVPAMTSNTAPYGEVSASSTLTYQGVTYSPYYTFSDNISMTWCPNGQVNGAWIQYKFTNPIEVKQLSILAQISGYTNQFVKTFKIQYSDDGSTYSDVESGGTAIEYTCEYSDGIQLFNIPPSGYHLYWRVYCLTNYGHASQVRVGHLQFYGRELSVSVPKMDTNTTPYGEAFATNQDGNAAYRAFDGDDSTRWETSGLSVTSGISVGYSFINPLLLRKVRIVTHKDNNTYPSFNIKIQASNDAFVNEVVDITNSITITNDAQKTVEIQIESEALYKSYRVYFLSPTGTYQGLFYYNLCTLQFYGLDYSEKEFEEGATRKWLYDHGLELETLIYYGGASNTDGVVDCPSSGGSGIRYETDLTPFDLIRVKIPYGTINPNLNYFGDILIRTTDQSTTLGDFLISQAYLPNNAGLSTANINQLALIIICNILYNGANTIQYSEIWLE